MAEQVVKLTYKCGDCEKVEEVQALKQIVHCECGGEMILQKTDLYVEDRTLYYSVPCISCQHRARKQEHCIGCIHCA